MSAQRGRLRAATLFAALATLSVWSGAPHAASLGPWPPAGGKILDRLAAIVNTEPITLFELRRAATPFVAKAVTESGRSELPARLQQVQAEVLDNLINDILVYAEAKKLSLSVSPERVDAHLARIRDANGWTDDQLAQELRKLGFASLSDYRRHTEREMMKSQVISIKVGSRVKVDEKEVDAEVARRLGTNKTVEERRAAHILLTVGSLATDATVEETRARLLELRQRILSGEESFEEAARRVSEDPGTRAAGGDVGWFVRGDFDPDFEAGAFATDEGEISAPTRSQFGWHLIKVTGIRERAFSGGEDLEKMKREITFKLREKALERLYTQWVRGLRAQAFIEIRDERYRLPSS